MQPLTSKEVTAVNDTLNLTQETGNTFNTFDNPIPFNNYHPSTEQLPQGIDYVSDDGNVYTIDYDEGMVYLDGMSDLPIAFDEVEALAKILMKSSSINTTIIY